MSAQLPLPGTSANKVVNVASVPHRSPFRYPGGKTWLVPRIRQWLLSRSSPPKNFIEAFAGGSIVGLTVAFEELAQRVTLIELDEKVASVWQAIIEEGEGQWLAEKIEGFDLTLENVEELLAKENLPTRERAFQTIVHNRVSRGGILAKGAGLIKYGESGKGIASRWYPQTIAKRILKIHKIRDRITFVRGDGLEVIEQHTDYSEVVFFVDPPYTAGSGKRAGRRLYEHSELNHKRLFKLMSLVRGDFVMTYDNDKDIRSMSDLFGFETYPIAMKNTHHAEMTELLVGRDLEWVNS